MGELKKYQIRATRRPAKNPLVSSVVLVRNEAGENGYCYINFAPSFVARVGAVLSRGVSEVDPAFVSVRFYPRTGQWLVIAQYARAREEALLWRTASKPEWLNFYRTPDNGSSQAQSNTRGSRAHGSTTADRDNGGTKGADQAIRGGAGRTAVVAETGATSEGRRRAQQ